MADALETRGRVARTMEGAGGVEIKATIPDRQVDVALKAYNLALSENERYIYFFDTPELELFEMGVIARARRVVGGQHDSTIKFRPVDPASVPSLWRKYSGFKIEADACEKGVVKSASMTMPVAKGLIKRVAAGSNPISDLFTEEQLLFLLSLASKKIDYSRVVVMGPDPGLAVEAQRSGAALADHRRTVAARGWRPDLRGLHQDTGGPGGSRHGRLHGLPCGSRRRARRRPAGQDPLGPGALGQTRAASPCRERVNGINGSARIRPELAIEPAGRRTGRSGDRAAGPGRSPTGTTSPACP